jgi:hypothetical protein
MGGYEALGCFIDVEVVVIGLLAGGDGKKVENPVLGCEWDFFDCLPAAVFD